MYHIKNIIFPFLSFDFNVIITEISAAKSHQDFFDHKMIFFPNQKQHHLLAQGYYS
jgi:hypothetical protein